MRERQINGDFHSQSSTEGTTWRKEGRGT